VLARLAKQPKALVVAEGLALTGLVATVDYFTSWEVSLALFYLLPISLVTWGAGRWAGILLSGACCVAWLSIDTLIAPPSSHLSLPYWNSTVRLVFFLIFTLTLSSLKRALDREKELANTDPLTGVRNARSYRESVSAEIERAKR
jgi:K+-sensing histidine kinase KdpD